MKSRWLSIFVVMTTTLAGTQPYQLAVPGYHYEFPRDHFNHPEYQTEWWYYTGNVQTASGWHFGFELTFFRQGVDRDARTSNVWDVRDVWLAHLALSDIDGHRFFHSERLNRAGAGLAGADDAQSRVWNGNWQARWTSASTQTLRAVADGFSFDFSAHSLKPPVIHGLNGVSQKAEGNGHASHYVSLTRLQTTGSIEIRGDKFEVQGLAWMDHEFFTHQLQSNQTGWDWFSLQLDDGSDLMLFRLRHQDGSADPYSAGTYVDPQGHARHLSAGEFSLAPGATWSSTETHAAYPINWRIRVPALRFDASVTTRLPQQELTSKAGATSAYWEGAIEIRATREGRDVNGPGYLEMTGYAGAVKL